MSNTPSQVWKDRAEAARQKQKSATVAADTILDSPVDPADPWAAELRLALYRAEQHRVDAFAQYVFCAETAYQSAVLDELAQQERRARYGVVTTTAVPNSTLPRVTSAEDAARRDGAA